MVATALAGIRTDCWCEGVGCWWCVLGVWGRGVESFGRSVAEDRSQPDVRGQAGTRFPDPRGGKRVAKRHGEVVGACAGCFAPIAKPASGPTSRFCGRRCRVAANAESIRASQRRSAERRRAARPSRCRTCQTPIAGQGRRYCSDACMPPRSLRARLSHEGRLTISRACIRCQTTFETARNKVYCSTRCRNRAAAARQPGDRSGRGAGRRFPRVRYAARRAIFERDGWRCQICGAPIDPELRFPHPGAATIDHRDPDGPHDPTNWQSAHLGCNVSKGRSFAPGADPKLRRSAAA